MSNGDQILRAHATISSLRTNLPHDYEVAEAWVKEFNGALGKIEVAINMDLGEFKVTGDSLYRSVGSSNYITGDINYRIEEFSNVAGLQHIPFSGDNVEQTFYELQRVLKRERQLER